MLHPILQAIHHHLNAPIDPRNTLGTHIQINKNHWVIRISELSPDTINIRHCHLNQDNIWKFSPHLYLSISDPDFLNKITQHLHNPNPGQKNPNP